MKVTTALHPLSSVLCLLALAGGCENKALEQAQQEAREAKVTVQQLKHNLSRAEREIAQMRAELSAVQHSRDQLHEQIERADQERDQALLSAQQAQTAMTAQSSGQVQTVAKLQREVAELNVLVAEQQKLIEQLQKGAMVEPVAVVPQGQRPPVDPNDDL
jgi:predicted RNase H-like nuclease (RuvC/YqgF family)